RFSVPCTVIGPCSQSTTTKSKPARPSSSTTAGDGIWRNVPSTKFWVCSLLRKELLRKRADGGEMDGRVNACSPPPPALDNLTGAIDRRRPPARETGLAEGCEHTDG